MSTVSAVLKDAMLKYEDEKPETVSNDPLAKSEKSETTSDEGMGDK
ncbi:hypothetical protein RvY_16029 [Ramazzottius varieornatus]|uniref:Uncharacterized protein n=1 Tax=Ramazzottius varieornatus TaxID=947166 RepID=A0A1D1VWZ9_RAMVA|nr:hypothetical protein RvY_16029 [Ramazzottius varieornatus]